jgi:molecular chaperone GrpE (heat shock protein)
MKTAMQELKSDLLTTIDTCNEALEEIKDLQTRKACQAVVNLTIDNVLNRIDTELLEMEKEHIKEAHFDGKINGMDISHPLSIIKEITATDYYNETFKPE